MPTMRMAILAAGVLACTAVPASAFTYNFEMDVPPVHSHFGGSSAYSGGSFDSEGFMQFVSIAANIGESCIGGGVGCAIGIVRTLFSAAQESQERRKQTIAAQPRTIVKYVGQSEKQISEFRQRIRAEVRREIMSDLEQKYKLEPRFKFEKAPDPADTSKEPAAPPAKQGSTEPYQPPFFKVPTPPIMPAVYEQSLPVATEGVHASTDEPVSNSNVGRFAVAALERVQYASMPITPSFGTSNIRKIVLALK